jgi:NADPH:quinone reductase-like Zn-dependent oxidoreductase
VQKELDPEATKALSICAFSLDELSQSLSDVTPDDLVVCIAEVHNQPLLSRLSEKSFKCLQYLVGSTTKLLWVTASSTDSEDYASYGVMQGFFRAIRAEQADSHIISLSIEGKVDSLKTAQFIAKTFRASFKSPSSKELEYLVRGGLLMTGRAIEDVSGNDKLASLSSRRLQHKAWYDGPALQLSIGTRGALDTLRFVRDTKHDTDLGPNDVEINTKAWGLNKQDLQAIMDRQDFHLALQLGAECADIVTRVGRDCDASIKIGDRVCMVTPGCMRQYPRGTEKSVYKIPDSMSFEAATSMLVPSMKAYHALINVGRLERDVKVIIHTAASAVGQAAVRIAQMKGAEVIATFSPPLERDTLTKTMGLSEDQILDSNSIDFTQAVMKWTGEYGVDVVFNQLAGEDVVRASYECLVTGGRFLDIRSPTRDTNSALSISIFD